MLRATAVNCSFSCWIAAIWISFSRAIAFSGIVALSKTSESKSTPSFRSGFITSSDTPKLLLPDSLEIEPPTASISLAICSAVRVLVPFSSTFAIKCVMPLSCGFSASRPPRKAAPIATRGSRGSSRTKSRNPFDNSNFWISPAATAFGPSVLVPSEPFGFIEMTVRLFSVRYCAATRLISSTDIFCTASR